MPPPVKAVARQIEQVQWHVIAEGINGTIDARCWETELDVLVTRLALKNLVV